MRSDGGAVTRVKAGGATAGVSGAATSVSAGMSAGSLRMPSSSPSTTRDAGAQRHEHRERDAGEYTPSGSRHHVEQRSKKWDDRPS